MNGSDGRTPPSTRTRRRVLVAVAWLATAAAGATLGTFAVDAASSSMLGGTTTPLSDQQVARALAATPPSQSPTVPSPPASNGPSTTAPGRGTTRAFGTPGGSVIARCSGTRATLVSWSPAQGYETEDLARGPATAATLTFEADDHDVQVRITCRGGVPTAASTTRSDDHSGRDHD